MAKYKVGDKVLVKEGLDGDTQYYMEDECDYWYPEQNMINSGGKVVTIKEVEESGHWYKCDGFDCTDYWTDEMFVGLAEETPSTYKVGDRVKIVGARTDNKAKHIGKVFTIRQLNPNGECGTKELHYGLVEDGGNTFIWFPNELQLYTEPEPTPAPIQVNVNVTVNINYDNACWYCRKGGLVDTYFAGKPGICPHCGRVCNAVAQSTQCYKPVEPVKEVKKENNPLTTEELEALPEGTRVFTVWLDRKTKEELWNKEYTRWRIKKGDRLFWEVGSGRVAIDVNGIHYKAYLEEPKRPEPELPF